MADEMIVGEMQKIKKMTLKYIIVLPFTPTDTY